VVRAVPSCDDWARPRRHCGARTAPSTARAMPFSPRSSECMEARSSVIDAARDAFARHGVTASLDDVARAAGVGPGTPT